MANIESDMEYPGGSVAEILSAVERATAAYDWPAVFKLVEEGLARPGLTAAEEYDLRAARMLPNWFHGHLDARDADAAIMLDLARKTEDTGRLVNALHELHWSQHLRGDYAQSWETIEEAYALVQTIEDPAQEARTLNFMGYAARILGNVEAVETYHQSALALSRNGVSPWDESWALEFLALLPPINTDPALVDAYLQEALAAAHDGGALPQEGSCLMTISNRSSDYARKRYYMGLARDIAEKTDSPTTLAHLENSLGIFYWHLGLYGQAARHAAEAIRLQRQYAFTRDAMFSLDSLGWIALYAGDRSLAQTTFAEILDYARGEGMHFHRQGALGGLGRLSLNEGRLAEAASYLQEAAAAYEHTNKPGEQAIMLASLALVYLEQGNSRRALDTSAGAIALAAENAYLVRDFPLQDLWWQRYQVLDRAGGGDEEAWEALEKARQALFEPVTNISDEGLRRNYLNKPPFNRAIGEIWAREAAQRGISLAPFTERETTPAALAEQLERIVASGARLAAERDTDKLAEFILQEFIELSGVERAVVALKQPTSDTRHPTSDIVWAATAGLNKNDAPAPSFISSFIRQAADTRSPVLEDAAGDVPEGELPELHLRSVLALPLVSQGEVWGVLYGDMRHLFGRLSNNDRDILSLLANQAGAALENADWVQTLEQQVADRTAEVEAAREVAEAARIEAERANQAKSAFMSNMSHELRTPLNAIIGFTRIVQRKTKDLIPAKQFDNLGKVRSSSEHLLGLINTVLDIAKIEAGRMDVISSRVPIGPLIEATATVSKPLLKSGVALKLDIKPDLPDINSDQDKIKQILLNLLSNAAKFTHEGAVTVSAGRHGDMLRIDVTDTGIGMNEEALGRVFEEFQQANAATRKKYGGTGLGMPISKHLAQLLGGDLTVNSTEGKGSTFTLTLPVEKAFS